MIAGSLADPTLRITSDEIDRTRGPRQNKMFFTVEQEFLLWGKLDLRRDQANANTSPPSSRARARAREAAGNQRPWRADKVERWAIDRLIPYAKKRTDPHGCPDCGHRRKRQGVGLDDASAWASLAARHRREVMVGHRSTSRYAVIARRPSRARNWLISASLSPSEACDPRFESRGIARDGTPRFVARSLWTVIPPTPYAGSWLAVAARRMRPAAVWPPGPTLRI
jgi:hypothetical protein